MEDVLVKSILCHLVAIFSDLIPKFYSLNPTSMNMASTLAFIPSIKVQSSIMLS